MILLLHGAFCYAIGSLIASIWKVNFKILSIFFTLLLLLTIILSTTIISAFRPSVEDTITIPYETYYEDMSTNNIIIINDNVAYTYPTSTVSVTLGEKTLTTVKLTKIENPKLKAIFPWAFGEQTKITKVILSIPKDN